MDTIFITGICVHAFHGGLPEEQRLSQRFVIHLELDVDLAAAGRSDDLSLSVCYASVHDLVVSIAKERRFNLIEALAEAIATAVLERFSPVQALRITVEKPSAPIAGVFDSVGITLRRERNASR